MAYRRASLSWLCWCQRPRNLDREAWTHTQAVADGAHPCADPSHSCLPPIVFIPGFAGSLLDASVSRDRAANPMCSLSGTDHVWFDAEYFVPLLIDCWMEEMRLQLNVTASITSALELEDEAQGVHVHTVSYGSIKDSLFDYGIFHGGTGVWTPIIAQLEKLGFNASHLFAAPYDWRRGPGYWKQHDWPRLKTFLEEKVREFARPAIVMAVSQGSPFFAGFLHHAGVDVAWKKEHLASFFSFSGVFGGTVGGLGLAMWGDARPLGRSHAAYDLKVDFASRESLRDLLRGWGGVSMLLPRIHADTAFIQLPPNFKGNVTWDNLDEALGRVSTEFAALYELSLYYPISGHPGVKTHCFFGSALRSPAQYVYRSTPMNASESKSLMDQGLEAAEQLGRGKKPDLMSLLGGIDKLAEEFIEPASNHTAPLVPAGPPGSVEWWDSVGQLLSYRQPDELVTTDGDGLVPRESLAICEAWAQAEDPSLAAEIHEVKGRSHGSELFDPEVLLAMRASVAKVAGVKNPDDRSTPFGKPSRMDRDMARPLEEFIQIVGPDVARWDCRTWAMQYFSDGDLHGCSGKLILASSGCQDPGCRQAFTRDPETLSRRCPETCGGRLPKHGLDLPRPLEEFEAILGPQVASWSCQQWTNLYDDVLDAGCAGDAVMKAKNCDEGCRSAFRGDRSFMQRRCPATCQNNGTDLPQPLKQFEHAVGPEVASWDCPKWVKLYHVPDCAADQILSSPSCDEGCHRAFADDPFFLFRRCPETCTRGRNADSMQLAQSVPAKGDRDAHVMASKGGHAAPWDPWALGKWLPLLLLPFPFLLAARNLRGRPPAAAGEAGTPLHDAGEFSEFEGRAPVRSWWPLGSLGTRPAAAREVELQGHSAP
ncbi:PLA2G15 [Symbiodinium necroappetens]|uniref:PLA2G15 protein n=1 Tax=Symbiodinium necroappetens TaxID=1628268 RepID=A0A812K0N1_9DINO|nr:PLA2G15 [Symbiodinium necroappetens]